MSLQKPTIRVLVVDDYEPWRRFVISALEALEKELEFQVVGEASDGSEAVQKAEELQPDLILLDIGLPTLNGIEAAHRICNISPKPKILFISENRSPEIASEALRVGGIGYVIKSSAGSELFPAIRAVLKDDRFVSSALAALIEPAAQRGIAPSVDGVPPLAAPHRHEMVVYSDDASFVDSFARGAGAALKNGDAVIVLASLSHREAILCRLQADGADMGAAIDQGRYLALDNADTLSAVMGADMPDPVRCAKMVGDLIVSGSRSAGGKNARVAFFGECAPRLLTNGDVEAAIQLEHLWDELMKRYDAYTLCGYLANAFPHGESEPVFERICAHHTAVHRSN